MPSERPLLFPNPTEESAEEGYRLIAHNKKVLKGWAAICDSIPGNAARCYKWLRETPTTGSPRRCYAMKHKNYAGVWCFEVGSGQRIYYKPLLAETTVYIYYAGNHPHGPAPCPPSDDEMSL